jgi:DNA-binding NtrC family response regulator
MWVLAAASEVLIVLVREQRFRADLYHRLSAITFTLPPLRERGDDILRLADHFLGEASRRYAVPPKTLSAEARVALLGHPWPGDVRELANVMEGVTILVDAALVPVEALGLTSLPPAGGPAPPDPATPSPGTRGRVRADPDRRGPGGGGRIARAAATLRLPRSTLRYRLQRLGLDAAAVARAGPDGTWRPPAAIPAGAGGEAPSLAL